MLDKEIVYCPKCGSEDIEITVEDYVGTAKTKKISMDELAERERGRTTSDNYSFYSNPEYLYAKKATCKKCGYSVSWLVRSTWVTYAALTNQTNWGGYDGTA